MTADSAAPHLTRPTVLDRLLATRVNVNWETAVYVAIFAIAFGLRFWDLGGRALHHDESIHAQWSWDLLRGNYRHSPVFHGPLYYHVEGLVFFLFGSSDYTARVSAALFGTALLFLPLLLRRRLGAVGTMAAVALLAFSPTLVYYSRFFREDIYMAFFILLMAVAVWRYLDDERERWLIVFALGFTGAVTTKEGSFLVFAIFLVYLDVYLASILARSTLAAREIDTAPRRVALTGSYSLVAWLGAAFWPFLPGLRRRLDWPDRLPLVGDMLVLLGTLTLPLLTPVSRVFLERFGIVAKDVPFTDARGVQKLTSRLNWERHLSLNVSGSDRLTLAALFTITTSAAAFVGLQWRPRVWAVAFGACALIYLTLMTSFWTNLDGLISGPWGSIDYWREQQHEYRGDQPWYYFYLLFPAYEFLPLAICVGGAWWSVVRGNAFSRFLVVWLVGQILVFSWGSEKMPWLNTHLAVPACLLAAWTVHRAWQAWRPSPRLRAVAGPLLSIAAIAAGGLAVAAFLPGGTGWLVVRCAVAVAAIAAIAWAARPWGRPAVPVVLVVAAVGALVLFSVRTMLMASFVRGDVPKDMLIYTQSSPDIVRLMDDIKQLAEATGDGYNLPIAVDSSDSYAWPWAWYLRDYTCVAYADFASGPPQTTSCNGAERPYAVMLVNYSNRGKVDDAIARGAISGFGSPQRYPHRWWFPEGYKDAVRVDNLGCTAQAGDCGPFHLATWETLAEGFFQHDWLSTWLRYWRDHDPDEIYPTDRSQSGDDACNSCGSTDAYAFFPAGFDMNTGKLSARAAEPPRPGEDAAGRPTFGSFGTGPAQFVAPVDIESDSAGNLYVVDSRTRKLQKFDPQGNLIGAVDVRLNPADTREASEPWGLAVAPDGTIAVADTFGWRVRLFDTSLRPTGVTFGEPPADPAKEPGPYELYGPRDLAFDAEGNIWVTDTGHARVVVYDRSGRFLRSVGASKGAAPGQFDEPVGLDIAADGTVFVADMFNARVVVLGSDGAYRSSFPVDGWGGKLVTDKPYIRALRDGRVALSLPSLNQVRVYDRSGNLQGNVTAPEEPVSRPYGIVERGDGKLWIVEGGSARVRQFPAP